MSLQANEDCQHPGEACCNCNMKSSIRITHGGNRIHATGDAANELFKALSQQQEPKMKPFQERVIIEKSDLDKKIERLSVFAKAKEFFLLPPAEQIRLTQQENLMRKYSDVLGERIAHFK